MSSAPAVDQRLLVRVAGVRFLGGDEARAHVCEVRAHCLRGENRRAVGDRTRQDHRAVVELAHLREQRERRERAGVSACTCAHEDQPVDARLQRALGMLHVGHVVIHEPAVRMRRLHDLVRRAQAGDLDRHAILLAQRDVAREPVVRCVHDLVDGERCDPALGCCRLNAASSSVICTSHSSSTGAGRAFNAGNAPTTPALHCSMTRRGFETMNKGEPMTGSRSCPRSDSGIGMQRSPRSDPRVAMIADSEADLRGPTQRRMNLFTSISRSR